jgi:hypothetical protein
MDDILETNAPRQGEKKGHTGPESDVPFILAVDRRTAGPPDRLTV